MKTTLLSRTVLLLATALAMTGCAAAAKPSTAPVPIAVQLADFKITPATISVSGASFTFNVNSQGPTLHNFNIRNDSGTLVSTKDLRAGDSDAVTAALPPGTYTYFCAFPGHESLGMHGTLTVTGP